MDHILNTLIFQVFIFSFNRSLMYHGSSVLITLIILYKLFPVSKVDPYAYGFL